MSYDRKEKAFTGYSSKTSGKYGRLALVAVAQLNVEENLTIVASIGDHKLSGGSY